MIILGKMAICTISVLKKWKHNQMCSLDMFILVLNNMGSGLYLSGLTFKTMDDLGSLYLFYLISHHFLFPHCLMKSPHLAFHLKNIYFFLECLFFVSSLLSFLLFILLVIHQYLSVCCIPGRHWDAVVNKRKPWSLPTGACSLSWCRWFLTWPAFKV